MSPRSCARAFRFPRLEDAEASYKVLGQMATIDLLPDLAAWKIVQRIVARINPKVAQVDINQLNNPAYVRALEESGFLAEARRKTANDCKTGSRIHHEGTKDTKVRKIFIRTSCLRAFVVS